jgi:L-lactate utilization protein LutC
MSDTRETFLRKVREAVQAGNRPGTSAEIPRRGHIGYQGAGGDAALCFCEQFRAAGGQAHLVADAEAAAEKVLEIASGVNHQHVLLGTGAVIESLNLSRRLEALGSEIIPAEPLATDNDAGRFFKADLGITGVDYLIAETGTVVYLARPAEPRSLSLLPPVHIAVASADQLVLDLFDFFELPEVGINAALPSCISLITGPSKTGDIELTLVTGVHGPGAVHVVLLRR